MPLTSIGAEVAHRLRSFLSRSAPRFLLSQQPSAHQNQSLPLIPHCPPPSCACAATPDLDIDRTTPLLNTAPRYSQHLVISTGKSDWASKIEFEPGEGNVAAHVKALLGRGGHFFDPTRTVLVSNASFAPPAKGDAVGVFVWPAFRYMEGHVRTRDGAADLVERSLAEQGNSGEVGAEVQLHAGDRIQELAGTTVLICSHGGRDKRCGVIGPLLKAEFERQVQRASTEQLSLEILASPYATSKEPEGSHGTGVSVGLVSHIGGHKWAGNVIVYVSPKASVGGQLSSLAGRGVWYGRVEPKHVEGIVKETILGGRVIEELFRGIV